VSFGSRIAAALREGGAIVRQVVSTVQQYAGTVLRLVRDATSLFHTVQALPGNFGRFFDGVSATFFGLGDAAAGSKDPTATVPKLTAQGAHNRAAVSAALAHAQASASTLSASTTATHAADAQAVMTALGSATQDPGDRVRLFQSLATFVPPAQHSVAAIVIAQSTTTDLWRRAAVTALARASSAYQPASYDDAAALRALVLALIDAEIDLAGDQGEDDVFAALRALKTAVAQDLTTRGATLAPIIGVSFSAPLPAPLIAMKLYQDAARTDELVAEAAARHPAFMPVSFKALAT
jgi:prophage DNA circulation protein